MQVCTAASAPIIERRDVRDLPVAEPSPREVWLLQRATGKPGKRLNKTTGRVHRAAPKAKGVNMPGGVTYERIDDAGLHVTTDGKPRTLAADNVVI